MSGAVDTDEGTLERLQAENRRLRRVLESRIAIEQAKGTLAERLGITPEDAFALLRYARRIARKPLHELAREVRPGRPTPRPIVVALARSARLRAAAQRERAEAHRDAAQANQDRIARLRARLRAVD